MSITNVQVSIFLITKIINYRGINIELGFTVSKVYSIQDISVFLYRSVFSYLVIRDGRPRARRTSTGKVKNFLFSKSSRPALGSTQPPI
jgi:hypothetical protein